MMFVDETKKAIDVFLLKDKNPKAMSVGEALGFYYKASLIPMVLAAIVAAIFGALLGGVLGIFLGTVGLGSIGSLLGAGIGLIAIVFILVLFWVMIPIGLLIDAAIYHIFGLVLKQFKQGYGATLSAMVYASMVFVLLFFLYGIPILGLIIAIIAFLWGLVSIIVWMGRFQKISWVMSLVVLVVTWIVLSIIIFVIFGSLGLTAMHAAPL